MDFEKIYNDSNKSLKESANSDYFASDEYGEIVHKLYNDAQQFFAEKTKQFESTALFDAQEQTGVTDGEADPYIGKIDDAINDLAQLYCDLLRYQVSQTKNIGM